MHNEAAEIREGERQHKKIRKFDGEAYHLQGEEKFHKSAAEGAATYWRRRNHKVRIVKEAHHNEWLIYIRKKKE